jgi:hypothetical protein
MFVMAPPTTIYNMQTLVLRQHCFDRLRTLAPNPRQGAVMLA